MKRAVVKLRVCANTLIVEWFNKMFSAVVVKVV